MPQLSILQTMSDREKIAGQCKSDKTTNSSGFKNFFQGVVHDSLLLVIIIYC